MTRIQAAVGLAALAGLLVAATPVGSSADNARPARTGPAGREVTVTPNTRLFVGNAFPQAVRVDWSGFPASAGSSIQQVYLRQCKAAPTKLKDCESTFLNGYTREDGTGTALMQVRVDPLVLGFPCDLDHDCSIGAFEDPERIASATFSRISFASSPDNCPTLTSTGVNGSGTGALFRLILQWEVDTCGKPYQFNVIYTQTNSSQSKRDFIEGKTDFAATGIPFSDEPDGLGNPPETKLLEGSGKTYAYAPLSASSTVLAYNLFTVKRATTSVDEQVTDLKLSPDVMAKIFTGQIRNWNAKEIIDLNPQYQGKLPTVIKLSAPAFASANTYRVSSWLHAEARAAYEAAGGPFADGPIAMYPATDTVTWSDWNTIALRVASPPGSDYFQYGYLGWMDASTAARFGLPTARLQNHAGEFVGPLQPKVLAGLAASKPRDGLLFPDFQSTDPEAYPLPAVTYGILPTNRVTGAEGRMMRDFLTFGVTDGQEDLPDGYVPLPEELVAQAKDAIAKIPTTDPSVTPSPTQSSTPIVPSGSPPPFSSSPTPGAALPSGGSGSPLPENPSASVVDIALASSTRPLPGGAGSLLLPILAIGGAAALVLAGRARRGSVPGRPPGFPPPGDALRQVRQVTDRWWD